MIQAIAGAATGGLLIGALVSGTLTSCTINAQWESATNKLKVEAAEQLQKATEEVAAKNIAALIKVRELEAQHVQTEKNLDVIQRRNRALAAQLGGLRDPGRRPSRSDAVPGTPLAAESLGDAASTGYLSREASAVLLDAAAEADALASYARTCYDYVQSVVSVKRDES